jgi:hypothetical protein
MGHEFIGECSTSEENPELGDYETALTIKYIKRECGQPPRGVDVKVTSEDHELGSYPIISVVWNDYTTEYPGEYIEKCVEAFERFELPEEIHKRYRELFDLRYKIHKLIDPD